MTETWSLERYRAHLAGASMPVETQVPHRPHRTRGEYDEQVRLFAVIESLAQTHPDRADELEDVYSTSSGGKRSRRTAGMMKDAGQRRGVLDIEVWVPRGPWHGAAIELKKAGGGRATPEQAARIKRLTARGYLAVLHHGWISALSELCNYLGLPMPQNPEALADHVLARRAFERRLARKQGRSRPS